jgi:two-component sensor histidine kinase
MNDAARRVQIFADMHQHLYADHSGANLDLKGYLQRLVDSENAGPSSGSGERQVHLSGVAVQWPALDAPNIGLVTLELISNALKYGAGQVGVTVSDLGAEVEVAVEDEGRDLPR